MTQKRSLLLIGAGIVILVSGARYFWFGTEAAPHAVEPHAHHQAPSSSERKVLYYRHPMGKNVKSPVPMKDEMGMDFIPVYAEEAPREPRGPVDGRTAFLLSESGRQLIGVRTAKVERQSVNYEIKASGRVAFDPELYTVVSEYKVAKAAAGLTHHSAAAIQGGAQAMLQAVKLKLKLRGLSDKQIQMIEQGKFEADDLLLPQGRVWVYADVYEYELPNLKEGQVIEAESVLYADKKFKGKVISVSSIINAETRTVEV
ncbi:MAG: efflux RND transporter periplasmic adaptor subunit, partial [Oligoflexia bacterium]|nr:efflux RND transporter periplasmic adaptor subunit [Oligoflexia bacterium]